jgi:hypothetical protein
MPSMGFESTTPASEGAKTIHALDNAATVIGNYFEYRPIKPNNILPVDCLMSQYLYVTSLYMS